ncbi:hypothetical protein [Pseudarthrobacter siccitolerans]|uniref:hypothetical protein n=1 Tax=Pseudarthrobacter siccitolerans TaxID=861266 RepID=UPI00128B817C|nr:hypothetical protein [Pseudarthrobacter siccitolerans]
MDAEFWVAVAAVAISVVALIRGEIHQRRGGPETARRRAVDSVVEALGAVVALIEHADIKMPSSSEISAAMQNFERECLRWEPMLPTGARHVRVSVRQAMAHCFGPPACGAIDPSASEKPVHPFDRYWWDIGTTYLEHARNCLGTWLIDDRRNRQTRLSPYYLWRRDEDDAARAGYSQKPAVAPIED